MELLMLSIIFTVLLHNVKSQSGIPTSENLTSIGFDQLHDVAEEGQANKFVRIRLLTGPVSDDITGSVVPLTVEQLESYVFNTFRVIPPELWQHIDDITDPAEYEEGMDGRKDFKSSIIYFTIPAGDKEYDILTSDIIIDDSVSEAPENFILVLDSVEPADSVELDTLYQGILVFTIIDNDGMPKLHTISSIKSFRILSSTASAFHQNACNEGQSSAPISITVGVVITMIVAITMAGLIMILVLLCVYKKKKGSSYVHPGDYETPTATNIEMLGNAATSKEIQENIAYGAGWRSTATGSTNPVEMYAEVEQQTAATAMETHNRHMGHELEEDQATLVEMNIDETYEDVQ